MYDTFCTDSYLRLPSVDSTSNPVATTKDASDPHGTKSPLVFVPDHPPSSTPDVQPDINTSRDTLGSGTWEPHSTNDVPPRSDDNDITTAPKTLIVAGTLLQEVQTLGEVYSYFTFKSLNPFKLWSQLRQLPLQLPRLRLRLRPRPP
jgi:hypothetical protein